MSNKLNELVAVPLKGIREAISSHYLSEDTKADILGNDLEGFVREGLGLDLINLALAADCLRIATECLGENEELSKEEAKLIVPLVRAVGKLLAKYRREYQQFSKVDAEAVAAFLAFYKSDQKPFGYACQRTKWSGMGICARVSAVGFNHEILNKYEAMVRSLGAYILSDGDDPDRVDSLPIGFEKAWEETRSQLLPEPNWDESSDLDDEDEDFLDSDLEDDDDEDLDEEEPADEPAVTVEFDETDWPLAAEGDVAWSEIIDACGTPTEGSIPGDEEWEAAVSEGRVVTVFHSDAGRPYFARAGLHRGSVICRAVFSRPINPGITIQDVDPDDIDWDFESTVSNLEEATFQLLMAVETGDVDATRAAIRAGANVNDNVYCEEEGEITPLRRAVEAGYVEVGRLLLKAGADVSYDNGSLLWRLAVLDGQDDMAALLAEAGAERKPLEAFIHAAHAGNTHVVERLLGEISDINESTWFASPFGLHGTALTAAAAEGHLDVIRLLLDKGAHVNRKDHTGITPWAAAAAGGRAEALELLESRGAKGSLTLALLRAVQLGNAEVVRQLVERGADPNGSGELGEGLAVGTLLPLEAAVESNSPSAPAMIDALVGAGADPNPAGIPLLLRCAGPADPEIVTSKVAALLANGSSVDSCDEDSGATALHVSADWRHAECVRLLLEHGADPDARDKNGMTALLSHSAECVCRLLGHGADPNARDKSGTSPLLNKCKNFRGDEAIWEMLALQIAYGADLKLRTPGGKTALDILKQKRQEFEDGNLDSWQEGMDVLSGKKDLTKYVRILGRRAQNAEECIARAEHVIALADELEEPISHLAADELEAAVAHNPEIVSEIQNWLTHEDWRYRYAAAVALGRIGEPARSVTSQLLESLGDDDEDVRGAVSEALGRLAASEPALLESLLVTLSNDGPYLREAAADSIGRSKTNDPAVVDRLFELLGDETALYAAGSSLGSIGQSNGSVIPRLAEIVRDAVGRPELGEYWHRARLAAEVLGKCGSAAIPSIAQLLAADEAVVRDLSLWAITELPSVPDSFLPQLEALLKDQARRMDEGRAAYTIASKFGRHGVIRLHKLYGDSDPRVRRHTVQFCVDFGDCPEALRFLLTTIDDSDLAVQRLAIDYMNGGIGGCELPTGAVPVLVTKLRNRLPGDEESLEGIEAFETAALHEALGKLHVLRDDVETAVNEYKKALWLNPSSSCLADSSQLRSSLGDETLANALDYYIDATEKCDGGEYEAAIQAYREAIDEAPDFPWGWNDLAWLMATCSEPAYRDGDAAVKYATTASGLAGDRYYNFLDTLAAAYAEAGDFAKAAEIAEKVVRLVPDDARDEYRFTLDRYRSGQPWCEYAGAACDTENND